MQVKMTYKIELDGKKYGRVELYSLRNHLKEALVKADPLEDLMTYCHIPPSSEYELRGLIAHITELQKATERKNKHLKDIRGEVL